MNGFERAQKAYEEELPSYFDSVERTDDELEDDMLDDMNEDDMRELLYSLLWTRKSALTQGVKRSD
ncbi:hypothetical protein BIY40_02455 [Pediococcus acidilactici]|nr:hypothetical protein BIY40_02455 [Pediococcus acidilactici]